MAKILIDFNDTTSPIGGNWNTITDPTVTGLKIADLIDENGDPTGLSFTLDVAFTLGSGSTSQATSGAGGLPEKFFENYFYTGSADPNAAYTIGGNNGDAFSSEIAGHASSSDRDTNHSFTGAISNPTLYDCAGTGVPADPSIITGTVTGGGVTGTQSPSGSAFSYVNGLTIEFTAGGQLVSPETPVAFGDTGKTIGASGFTNVLDTVTIQDDATGNYVMDVSASLAGTKGNETYDLDDVVGLLVPTLGVPCTSASHTLNLKGTDSVTAETASGAVVINPPAGYVRIELLNARTTVGSIFLGWTGGAPADTGMVLYPSDNATDDSLDNFFEILADGTVNYSVVARTKKCFYYDIAQFRWEPFTLIFLNGGRDTGPGFISHFGHLS